MVASLCSRRINSTGSFRGSISKSTYSFKFLDVSAVDSKHQEWDLSEDVDDVVVQNLPYLRLGQTGVQEFHAVQEAYVAYEFLLLLKEGLEAGLHQVVEVRFLKFDHKGGLDGGVFAFVGIDVPSNVQEIFVLLEQLEGGA
jgi:hypothetical protein